MTLEDKIKHSIKILQMVKNKPVELSYSGGKDSDVILELAKMAGVNFRAIYKNTTIDPPGTIKHCKEMGVEILRPKMSFFDIIRKKGFPTRRARFCCEILKEYKVMDTAIQGIRRSESIARSNRYSSDDPIICRVYGNKKNHVSVVLPILDWTNDDVAEFIERRGIQCHPLYYKNGHFDVHCRLGCVGCPMASDNGLKDFKQYPNMVKAWCRAGQYYLDTHPNCGAARKFHSAYDLFVHNVFFRSYEDFRLAGGGIFGSVDMREFLEDYFKIRF